MGGLLENVQCAPMRANEQNFHTANLVLGSNNRVSNADYDQHWNIILVDESSGMVLRI